MLHYLVTLVSLLFIACDPYFLFTFLIFLIIACMYTKSIGDGVTSEARASPLLSLLHKEISLQMKIIGNHVIIAERLCPL